MQRGEGDCVNQQFEKIQSLLRSAWRNRWQGLLAAWVVGAIGAVVIYAIPERYEASARIYVDTQTVLKPLMRDLAVQPDVQIWIFRAKWPRLVGMMAWLMV
jgi:hypothetical protein